METISKMTAMTMKAVIRKPRSPGVTWSAVNPLRSPPPPGDGEGDGNTARTASPRTWNAAIKPGTTPYWCPALVSAPGQAKEHEPGGGVCGYFQGR